MILGFTGSRHGMTRSQKADLYRWCCDLRPIIEAHHGVCIGADREFHEFIVKFYPNCAIFGYPSNLSETRADIPREQFAFYAEARAPLDRNHDIVRPAELVLAAPHTKYEILRSGTWAAVRAARRIGKPVILLEP